MIAFDERWILDRNPHLIIVHSHIGNWFDVGRNVYLVFYLQCWGVDDFDGALNGAPQFTMNVQQFRHGIRDRA